MANDFSGDADCVALWKFENNPNDSKGGNDLTAVNSPTYDSGDKKEGTYSADLESDSNQYFTITDGDLDAGFPGKNGTGEQSFSICSWVKPESFTIPTAIVNKFQFVSGKRSYTLRITTTGDVIFQLGYNGGDDSSSLQFDTGLSTGVWYHIAAIYDATDNGMKIRIWDDNAGALLDSNKEGTAGGDMSPTDSALEVGRRQENDSYCLDGKIDEVVFFKDVLTDAEIDVVRSGTFPLLKSQSVGVGAITPTGSLGLKTSVSMGAGEVIPSGALGRLVKLAVGSGAITPTGALAAVKKFFQNVGQGAITPVGTLGRKIALAVGSGAITPVGALGRKILIAVGGGSITPSGALNLLTKLAVGAGSITPMGTLGRVIKLITGSGAITPAGVLNRLIKITVGSNKAPYEYYITGDDDGLGAGGTTWLAQTFTPAISHRITEVKLKVYRKGSPGTLTVGIRETDVGNKPTGDDLCSGTIDGDALTSSSPGEWVEITLGAGCILDASTQYAIVIRAPDGIAGFEVVKWRNDYTSPTYTGGALVWSNDSGSSWVIDTTKDFMFEECGAGITPAGTLGRKILLAVGNGAVIPIGTLSTIKRFLLSVGGGAITPIGTLNRLIKIGVGAGAITPVGILRRLIKIVVGAGSITPAGALNRVIKLVVGSGTITPVGVLNRFIKITVGQGAITPVGVLATLYEWITLTLNPRSLALTLKSRSLTLSLKVRSLVLTLIERVK